MGNENESNERQGTTGFAGLASLLSNVDDVADPPPQAAVQSQTNAPKPKPPPPTQPSPTQIFPADTQGKSGGSSIAKPMLMTIGILVLIAILLSMANNNGATTSTQSPSQDSGAAQSANVDESSSPGVSADVNSYGASAPSEAIPPVGTDNILSTTQITYCLAQNIRLDAAQAALNQYSSEDVDRFNAMIADYNARCGQYRYEEGSKEAAQSAVEPFRQTYQAQGQAWFTGSD